MARGRMSPKVMSENKDSQSNKKHISIISDPPAEMKNEETSQFVVSESGWGVLWVDKPNACLHVCVWTYR